MDEKVKGYSDNDYASLFKGLVIAYKPKELVEIGIGGGYTLDALLSGVIHNGFGHIRAYDIFEEWPYHNQPNYGDTLKKYGKYKPGRSGVEILRGDFFSLFDNLEDNTIDFFNVDIAMDGDKYEFFLERYLKKLTVSGIAILEGGSEERDNISWMKKFKKKSIARVLKNRKDCFTVEPFPSLTLIKRKKY